MAILISLRMRLGRAAERRSLWSGRLKRDEFYVCRSYLREYGDYGGLSLRIRPIPII